MNTFCMIQVELIGVMLFYSLLVSWYFGILVLYLNWYLVGVWLERIAFAHQ